MRQDAARSTPLPTVEQRFAKEIEILGPRARKQNSEFLPPLMTNNSRLDSRLLCVATMATTAVAAVLISHNFKLEKVHRY
jgi:hypothetical protein